ncbi:unnamed protein product [Pseudo-nitzschia multistriata]|uniref:Uncharacterized protein n=1 Tax=Pseudo-nitzschia multistriata TaxID=183589 RepID=A0A448Z7P6_9STRA|nr:unnamed protein product [Pseudo-nitzschia multistriata]
MHKWMSRQNETKLESHTVSTVTYGGAQFIDNISNVVLRMKIKVARSVRFAGTKPGRHHVELDGNFAIRGVVIEFPDEILSQIGNVRHPTHERVQDQCVRVRIGLAGRDSGCVVTGVVHAAILFGAGYHALSHVWIVNVLDTTDQSSGFGVHRDRHQGRVPIIHCQ